MNQKKMTALVVALVINLLAGAACFAQVNPTIKIGETNIFYNCNYFFWWTENYGGGTFPPAGSYNANKFGNNVDLSLTATPGHEGAVMVHHGLQFDWDLNGHRWEDVNTMTLKITIEFSYYLECYYAQDSGSAHASITYPFNPQGPWLNMVGDDEPAGQLNTAAENLRKVSYFMGVQQLEDFGRKIYLWLNAHAHSGEVSQDTNHGLARATIHSIKVDFVTYSGYHDKTTKNFKLFNVDTNMVDDKPLVGGLIEFDGSKLCEEGGCVCEYNWDFGGGVPIHSSMAASAKPVVHFPEARRYPVTLVMRSSCSGNYITSRQVIDLTLLPGDLIFIRTPVWSIPFDLAKERYSHCGMYVGNGQMIEAAVAPVAGNPKAGVQLTPLSRWGYLTEPFATAFRVYATEEQRAHAVGFALTCIGKPYDLWVNSKQHYGASYYCSELIWAAYYDAAGIDLGLTGPLSNKPVHPDAIAGDTINLTFIGGHWEHYPPPIVRPIPGPLHLLLDPFELFSGPRE